MFNSSSPHLKSDANAFKPSPPKRSIYMLLPFLWSSLCHHFISIFRTKALFLPLTAFTLSALFQCPCCSVLSARYRSGDHRRLQLTMTQRQALATPVFFDRTAVVHNSCFMFICILGPSPCPFRLSFLPLNCLSVFIVLISFCLLMLFYCLLPKLRAPKVLSSIFPPSFLSLPSH